MNPQRRSGTKNGKNQEQCQSKSRPGAHTLLLWQKRKGRRRALLRFRLIRFLELEAKRELCLSRITDAKAKEAVEIEERGS